MALSVLAPALVRDAPAKICQLVRRAKADGLGVIGDRLPDLALAQVGIAPATVTGSHVTLRFEPDRLTAIGNRLVELPINLIRRARPRNPSTDFGLSRMASV